MSGNFSYGDYFQPAQKHDVRTSRHEDNDYAVSGDEDCSSGWSSGSSTLYSPEVPSKIDDWSNWSENDVRMEDVVPATAQRRTERKSYSNFARGAPTAKVFLRRRSSTSDLPVKRYPFRQIETRPLSFVPQPAIRLAPRHSKPQCDQVMGHSKPQCDQVMGNGRICELKAQQDDEYNKSKCGNHRTCHSFFNLPVANGETAQIRCTKKVYKGAKMCNTCMADFIARQSNKPSKTAQHYRYQTSEQSHRYPKTSQPDNIGVYNSAYNGEKQVYNKISRYPGRLKRFRRDDGFRKDIDSNEEYIETIQSQRSTQDRREFSGQLCRKVETHTSKDNRRISSSENEVELDEQRDMTYIEDSVNESSDEAPRTAPQCQYSAGEHRRSRRLRGQPANNTSIENWRSGESKTEVERGGQRGMAYIDDFTNGSRDAIPINISKPQRCTVGRRSSNRLRLQQDAQLSLDEYQKNGPRLKYGCGSTKARNTEPEHESKPKPKSQPQTEPVKSRPSTVSGEMDDATLHQFINLILSDDLGMTETQRQEMLKVGKLCR